DPYKAVYDNYYKQVELYNVDKKFTFLNMPAEDVDYSKYSFDFIFTSPPYFNIELYDNSSTTNSHKRYNDIDVWLNNFLFTTLKHSVTQLKENGYVVINISDIVIQSGRGRICDPMVKYATEELGLLFCGTAGYQINNRYVSCGVTKDLDKQKDRFVSKEKVLCEPIFIFKKGKKFNINELNTGIVKDYL
ncbi:MAG: hypothetical protein ABSG25_11400, partial [Bryobacteraceae bacterium]